MPKQEKLLYYLEAPHKWGNCEIRSAKQGCDATMCGLLVILREEKSDRAGNIGTIWRSGKASSNWTESVYL